MNESITSPLVGDSHRFITDKFTNLQSKKTNRKDRAIAIILFDAIVLLAQNDLPDIEDVWNTTYPGDPMDDALQAYIAMAAIDHARDFDPHDPAEIEKVIADLCEIHLHDLAAVIKGLLVSSGNVKLP